MLNQIRGQRGEEQEVERRRVRGGVERRMKWAEEKRADMGVEWREARGVR